MQKTQSNWSEKSLNLTQKKAHFDQIVSISIRDENTFFTSSEDNTVRLWDIRNNSSVKLIKSKQLQQNQISNCANDNQALVYIGSGCQIYSFDVRKQDIFIQQPFKQIEQAHGDDVNHLAYSPQYNIISACDDDGDIKTYSAETLSLQKQLLHKHQNICYSCEFIYPNKAKGPILISTGFDCKMNIWDVENEKCQKTIDFKELFQKHQISSKTLPIIHCVFCHENTIFASTQTGHVVCLPFNEPRKAKFILDASLAKVVRCQLAAFNKNVLMTLSADLSFSLFDYTKRNNGMPEFIQKYKVAGTPNWIQTMQSHIIVATCLPELSIYSIKG